MCYYYDLGLIIGSAKAKSSLIQMRKNVQTRKYVKQCSENLHVKTVKLLVLWTSNDLRRILKSGRTPPGSFIRYVMTKSQSMTLRNSE